MMNIENLKYYISVRLKALTNIKVYDAKAESGATFPYLVFKLTGSNFLERRRVDRYLEIDYWNNTNDDTEILAAAEAVKYGKFDVDGVTLLVPGLDYSFQNELDGFYSCYIEKDNEIEDPERNIIRWYQRYHLKIG